MSTKRRKSRARGHGGQRPGAGRPQGPATPPPTPPPAPPIDWEKVKEAAACGTPEDTIIAAQEIAPALEDAATLAKFRDLVKVETARFQIELRKTIRERGLRSKRSAGSVNALSLQARNHLDWDKLLPVQEVEPDIGTAKMRLKDLLDKMAEAQSEMRGRTVTVLELLAREAGLVDADGKKISDERPPDDEPDPKRKKGRS